MVGEEIEYAGKKYRMTRKLDAITQFHVVRRIAPLMANLNELVAKDEEASMVEGATAVITALAKISDQDCEYVIFKCLDVVQRFNEGQWAPVIRGSNFMFSDLDMGGLLKLTGAVIKENMASFFDIVSDFAQGEPAAT